jgi:hypothetical protein
MIFYWTAFGWLDQPVLTPSIVWSANGITVTPPAGGFGGTVFQSLDAIPAMGAGIESGLQQPWLIFDAQIGGI